MPDQKRIKGQFFQEVIRENDSARYLKDLLMQSREDDDPLKGMSFEDFVQDIFSKSYPQYDFNAWHIHFVCAQVDKLMLKPTNRYLTAALPRYHLKSTILGEAFAIYRMLTSYGDGMYISFKDELACLLPGTRIRTGQYSYKEIDKIKNGDTVLSHRAKFQKVTKTFKRQVEEEICVITLDNGEIIKVTKNHPILADNEWIAAGDLDAGMCILKPIGKSFGEYYGIDKASVWGKKISKAKMGHIVDEITKDKISKNNKGKTPWNLLPKKSKLCAECGKEFFVSENDKQHFCSLECYHRSLEKIVPIWKGKPSHMKGKKRTEITSQESEDIRKVNAKAGYSKYLDSLSEEEYTKHFSDIHQKSFSSAGVKPNKLEIVFIEFLNSNFPDDWRYTGDGAIWINGKNPDFVSNDKKLIIEIFGDYWHRGEDPLDRMAIFKSAGYDTLVIWESEFNGNKAAVKHRIEEFNGKRHIKILKVEREFYSGFVYNLEVENDHSYCGKGIIFHNCYHLSHIKEAIRVNEFLSRYLVDQSPQSDAIINYKMGNKKMKIFGSGIMAVKRGIHTNLVVVADDILGDLANPMILTELDKVKRLFNAEIMNIPNKECPLFVFGTTMDYSDILFSLKDNPNFLSIWLPAIDPIPDREILWPEQFNRQVLDDKKNSTDWKSFATEFLLTPMTAANAFFTRGQLDPIINKELRNFPVSGF